MENKVQGERFYYREMGSFSGRTVLIVHGWLGMSEHWLSAARFLADQGLHVIVPDLPNHGRSFHTDGFSYDGLARFLHDFLAKHSCGKPILIGHSMGGKTVMRMADMYPEEYEKIIVADILPIAYPDLCRKGGIADVILSTDVSRFCYRKDLLDHFKQQVSDKGWLALLMQNIETRRNRPAADSLGWKSNAVMLSKSMAEVAGEIPLGKVETPALLLRGGESEFTLQKDLPAFSEHFPNSEIVTLEGCSHWLFVDKPAAFLKEIASYIGQK